MAARHVRPNGKDQAAAQEGRDLPQAPAHQVFLMAQFSVYLRFCGSREQADTYVRRIGPQVPGRGQVSILRFTDKQYESMWCDTGREKRQPKNPEHYVLI